MKSFEAYCKSFIEDNLPVHESCSEYGADIGYMVTENINFNNPLC